MSPFRTAVQVVIVTVQTMQLIFLGLASKIGINCHRSWLCLQADRTKSLVLSDRPADAPSYVFLDDVGL